MPRTARIAPGGMVFHVLNRGEGRMKLFTKIVNQPQTEPELEAIRRSLPRGRPKETSA